MRLRNGFVTVVLLASTSLAYARPPTKGLRRRAKLPPVTVPRAAASPAGESSEPEASTGGGGRLHLGLRTGFGLPYGRYAARRRTGAVAENDIGAISKDTHGVVPLWLDVGYRLTPRLMLGAYAMYGLVIARQADADDPLAGGCPEGIECFAAGLRFGVQAQLSLGSVAGLEPWVGLGVGYEWIRVDLEGEVLGFPIDWKTRHSGFELLHLQAGVDAAVSEVARIGPFLSISAMRYSSCATTLDDSEPDCDVVDPAWHGWVVLGLRGSLEP